MRFEWDEEKNRANLRKHGVRFETALRVFDDPGYELYPDRMEGEEQRWHALGLVGNDTLLLVVHVYREDRDGTEVIRIISARPADGKERRAYGNREI